jgi:hypothetical protein
VKGIVMVSIGPVNADILKERKKERKERKKERKRKSQQSTVHALFKKKESSSTRFLIEKSNLCITPLSKEVSARALQWCLQKLSVWVLRCQK